MDARHWRFALACLSFLAMGARFQTPNFVVDAATPELAKEIGDAAERYREELAQLWLGKSFPQWHQPCPIVAKIGPQIGAGGVTTFVFDQGEVFHWSMNVQGSRERVLDSVLPHEITHTIFATHFRQPLPRWADEGACTTVEHATERDKQNRMLHEFLHTNRGIPFSAMFKLKEYPRDMLPLYAQGHSLATFLIDKGGRAKFIEYLEDGLQRGDWPAVTQSHYGFQGLGHLQGKWLEWVRQGSPLDTPGDGAPQSPVESIAANDERQARPESNLIYHGATGTPAVSTGERQHSLLPESRAPAPGAGGGLVPVASVPVNNAPVNSGKAAGPTSRAGAAPSNVSRGGDPFSAAQREMQPANYQSIDNQRIDNQRTAAAQPSGSAKNAAPEPIARSVPDQGWHPPKQRSTRDASTRNENIARQQSASPPATLPGRRSAANADGDGWQDFSAPSGQPPVVQAGGSDWPPETMDPSAELRTGRPTARTAIGPNKAGPSKAGPSRTTSSEGVRFDSQPQATIRR